MLLESEWVLRSGYGPPAEEVAAALHGLAGLPGVTVEEPPLLATALQWMAGGMDFADALQFAKADGCTAFFELRPQAGQGGGGMFVGECRRALIFCLATSQWNRSRAAWSKRSARFVESRRPAVSCRACAIAVAGRESAGLGRRRSDAAIHLRADNPKK